MSVTQREVDPSVIGGNASVALGFEKYRQLSDSTSNYRYNGITDPGQYQAALDDPLTLTVEAEGGTVPAVVPLGYIDGFDLERTTKLVGDRQPMFLTVPLDLIDRDVLAATISDNQTVVIVETDYSETGDSQKTILDNLAPGLRVHEFEDLRIEEGDHQTAWLAMYAARVEATGIKRQTSTDLVEAFGDQPVFPANGLSIITGETLQENVQARENLWELFNDRFDWLGDYHPVSMEDTREMFEEIITDPSTYVSAMFEDGEITCAGIFMHDVSVCSWVKPEVFEEFTSGEEGRTPMYFFGIASKKSGEPVGRMAEVVKFHCHLAAKAGVEYDLLFESSNMSSQYIPDSVKGYIDASKVFHIDRVRRVKRTDYWFISGE